MAVTIDRLDEIVKSIRTLAGNQVLVGVPEEKAQRQDSSDRSITNATLAYIHTNGAPEANIPARPFLEPGIKRASGHIISRMRQAADLALAGKSNGILRAMGAAGQEAASSAQKVIQEGIPPPLKESTVLARQRRSKGSKYRRKASSPDQTTPLIDTGALLRSITFVIRKV